MVDQVAVEAISLKSAARVLTVHKDTLKNWARAGKLLLVRLPGGHYRVPRSEIGRIRAGLSLSEKDAEKARTVMKK